MVYIHIYSIYHTKNKELKFDFKNETSYHKQSHRELYNLQKLSGSNGSKNIK